MSEPRTWKDAISRDEIAELLEMNDWRSWGSLVVDWGLIAASFALVAWWPSVASVLIALVVIGTRQLGLAVLMHEASHRSLFKNRSVNDQVGNWLCAYPVWSDIYPYRNYHLTHHAKTWTQEDPDLSLATPFPITPSSLRRKIWRDLSGQTGVKFAKGRIAGTLRRWRSGDPNGRMAGIGVVTTNLVLLGILTLLGHPLLYLLWVGAWLTTHTLVTRIRAIAEHSMPGDPTDELQHTRTTLASWLERLLIAPNRVNYHLEHHLVMMIPHYNLPRFHALLRERGVLEKANVVRGYGSVLRRAASASA